MQKLSRLKWSFLTALCFFVLFLLQGTGLFNIRPLQAYPMLLLPFLVTFSMYRSESVSAFVGLTVGIFMDGLSGVMTGFHSIFFLLTGLAVSLIAHYYFNKNIRSAVLLSLIISVCYYLARWLILFLLHGNLTDGAYYLFRTALPSLIYTNLFSIPFFFLHRAIFSKSKVI